MPVVVPTSNEGNLYALGAIQEYVRSVSFEEFAAVFQSPALELTIVPSTSKRGGTLAPKEPTKEPAEHHKKVCFLKKRPGNPFPDMISLGRGFTNDIAIGLETVSKVHVYFRLEGSEWSITDHRSQNGTALNDKPLEPNKTYPVRDGDRLRIGLDVNATFNGPETFYKRLRGA